MFKVIGLSGERSFGVHHIRSKAKAIAFAQSMTKTWWVVKVTGPKGVLIIMYRDGVVVNE